MANLQVLKILTFVLFICFNVDIISCQTTSDCGGSVGCFLKPSSCKDTNCVLIYKFKNNGDNTNFELNVNLGSTNNKWVAIGFSTDQQMGSDCVVVCKTNNVVQQNYNTGKSTNLLLSTNASIGILNQAVQLQNNWINCTFVRQKRLDAVTNYCDLNNKYYVLGAYGSFDANSGILQKHDYEVESDAIVDFQAFQTVTGSEDKNKMKAHACLMVIAWILFASTGILIARYYKFLLPKTEVCKTKLWFVLHRPIMILVPIITIPAFIVILAELSWTWVDPGEPVEFAHSIFGIVTIAIAVIQPFIGFVRCDLGHKYRFIFNYVHRTLGLGALLFSIVAMFLGSRIDDVGLGDNGWGILAGWSIWVVCLPVALEILELRFEPRSRSEDYQVTSSQKSMRVYHSIKIVLLIAHLIVALGFTVALVVLIGMGSHDD